VGVREAWKRSALPLGGPLKNGPGNVGIHALYRDSEKEGRNLQKTRMASLGAIRNDGEPLLNPYQTYNLCPVDLCPSTHAVFPAVATPLRPSHLSQCIAADIANCGLFSFWASILNLVAVSIVTYIA
jgi:hypothetical protein